jgi:UPF0716 family protein affecting phage T7 exclusion
MNKRGVEIAFETLAKWIIAILVLVIAIMGIIILKSRGSDLLNKLAELLRFGR